MYQFPSKDKQKIVIIHRIVSFFKEKKVELRMGQHDDGALLGRQAEVKKKRVFKRPSFVTTRSYKAEIKLSNQFKINP